MDKLAETVTSSAQDAQGEAIEELITQNVEKVAGSGVANNTTVQNAAEQIGDALGDKIPASMLVGGATNAEGNGIGDNLSGILGTSVNNSASETTNAMGSPLNTMPGSQVDGATLNDIPISSGVPSSTGQAATSLPISSSQDDAGELTLAAEDQTGNIASGLTSSQEVGSTFQEEASAVTSGLQSTMSDVTGIAEDQTGNTVSSLPPTEEATDAVVDQVNSLGTGIQDTTQSALEAVSEPIDSGYSGLQSNAEVKDVGDPTDNIASTAPTTAGDIAVTPTATNGEWPSAQSTSNDATDPAQGYTSTVHSTTSVVDNTEGIEDQAGATMPSSSETSSLTGPETPVVQSSVTGMASSVQDTAGEVTSSVQTAAGEVAGGAAEKINEATSTIQSSSGGLSSQDDANSEGGGLVSAIKNKLHL